MATLTLKKMPDVLYARLKKSAARHRRSMNSEAIVCLEEALTIRPVDPNSLLASVRTLRGSLGEIFLTDRDLRAAKGERRP
jgi:plasmid stability protein